MVPAISVVSIVSAVFMICYPCCDVAHHPPGASSVLSMVSVFWRPCSNQIYPKTMLSKYATK